MKYFMIHEMRHDKYNMLNHIMFHELSAYWYSNYAEQF